MTLDEAIITCERICGSWDAMGEDYNQLAKWLSELKGYRENDWIPVSFEIATTSNSNDENTNVGYLDDIKEYVIWKCAMPKNEQNILITVKTLSRIALADKAYRIEEDELLKYKLRSGWSWKDVMAWKPFPEPFKG